MKNVLIIYGGLSQTGFNWELYQEMCRFTNASNLSVQCIDLYREDFDALVRDEKTLFIRQIYIDKKMVDNYQDMIRTSDVIIMISPVWWSRTTTMLEGFFDKVFSHGFAFETEPKWKPLLSDKKVIMFLTLGNKSKFRQRLYCLITYLRLKLGVLRDCFSMNTKISFFSVTKSTTQTDKALFLESARGIIRSNL